jgi:hypothetical protein
VSEKYTKEMHEAYRKEQDEKAANEEEARNTRMEKENARRAWLAEEAGKLTSSESGRGCAMRGAASAC